MVYTSHATSVSIRCYIVLVGELWLQLRIPVYTHCMSKCSQLNVLTSCNGAAITDINCYFDFLIKWASLHVYLGNLCSVSRATSLVHRPCMPSFSYCKQWKNGQGLWRGCRTSKRERLYILSSYKKDSIGRHCLLRLVSRCWNICL